MVPPVTRLPVKTKAERAVADADPLQAALQTLRERIDQLFREFPVDLSGGLASKPTAPRIEAGMVSRLMLIERFYGYLMEIEMPGVDPQDIDLRISNGILLLNCETGRTADSQNARASPHSSSVRYSVRLPAGVEVSMIEARLLNGLLRIVLPKHSDLLAAPRRISIRAA